MFKQIMAVTIPGHPGRLFALDEEGIVWFYNPLSSGWEKFNMTRFI